MPIHTIGYGARSMADFIALLKQYGIDYLIDVRSRPYSAFKPEYSKRELEHSLAIAGIKYVYMGDLLGGQPESPAFYTPDGKVDYEKLQQQDFYRRGIGRLQEAFQKGLDVAIMCSEQKPEMCHRSRLIGRSLSQAQIPVRHIDEKGKAVSQDEILLRLTSGQLSLFGKDDLDHTSRKEDGPSQPDEEEEN